MKDFLYELGQRALSYVVLSPRDLIPPRFERPAARPSFTRQPPKPDQDVIDSVLGANLTADDLATSRLSETEFHIWLTLTAGDMSSIRLIYSTCKETLTNANSRLYFPRLSVESGDFTKQAFETLVNDYFMRLNHGRPIPERPNSEYQSHWGRHAGFVTVHDTLIHEDGESFTQKFIARMIGEYAKSYQVIVPNVYYRNVPTAVFKDPGFDKTKIWIGRK